MQQTITTYLETAICQRSGKCTIETVEVIGIMDDGGEYIEYENRCTQCGEEEWLIKYNK